MKLKRLTIHNIASIEDALIDFENGPLAEDSRFLICGPTGAGKTTLLDSICLVLYGTTPRLHGAKSEGYVDTNDKYSGSGNREDIKIDDARMLMRRGSLDACIELIFTDKDDKLLKAEWTCTRAYNKISGSIKDPVWTLIDAKNDSVISTKKKEVLQLIQESIGLTFEQFCRTTMLAQGDFTKFLKSDEGQKSEILEKLTGTDIYSIISKRIHDITNEKDKQYLQIKSKLEGVQLLSQDDLKSIREQQEATQKEAGQLALEEKRLTSIVSWLEQVEKLQKGYEQALSVCDLNQKELLADDFQQRQRLLTDWDNTHVQRQTWKERAQAEQMRADKIREEKMLKEQYERLSTGLLFLQQDLEQLHQRKQKAEEFLAAEEPQLNCYKQIGLIESLVLQYQQLAELIDKSKTVLLSKNQELCLLKENIGKQQEKVRLCDEQVKSKQEELNLVSRQFESMNYTQLVAQRGILNDRLTQLMEYRSLEDLYHQTHLALTSKMNEVKETEIRNRQLAQEVGLTEKKVSDLDKLMKHQEEIFEKQRLSCDDLMKEYRSRLSEGDVCPLCGQTITHLASDDLFLSVLRPVQDYLNELKDQHKRVAQTWAEQKAQLQAGQREWSQRNHALEEAGRMDKEVLHKKVTHILYGHFQSEEPMVEIDQAIAGIKKELSDLDARLKDVGDCQSRLNLLQREKDSLEKKLHLEENQVKEMEKGQARLHENIQSEQQKMDASRQSRKDLLQRLSSLIDVEAFKVQGDTCLPLLKKAAQRYQTATERYLGIERDLQNLEAELNYVLQAKRSIDDMQKPWKDIQVSISEKMSGLSALWSTLLASVTANTSGAAQAQHLFAEKDELLHRYFHEQQQISEKYLGQLAVLPVEEMERMRKEVQQKRDALLSDKAKVESSRLNLQNWQDQRPEMEEGTTYESVSALLLCNKEEISRVNQQLGKFVQTLETDKKNRQHFEAVSMQLEQVRKESDQWNKLHDLFGSADGKKFRNIAQSYVLEQLLVNANQYLRQFTDRYEMECQPGSLTILLRDNEAGGVIRPTTTISGGESFLISLSLALGLSSLSRASFSVDTLFIDEGFGTLDSSYLSAVMDALERLHQMGGKKIGIISHVESLKERLTTQIQVSKINNTSSKVSVVSLN